MCRRRLVQDGDGGPAGQGEQYGHHGHLPLGQLGNFLPGLQLELGAMVSRAIEEGEK